MAHVEASVSWSDVGDAKIPVFVVVTSECEPRVLADDRVVDGENSLGLHEYPSNLKNKMMIISNFHIEVIFAQ